MAWQKGKSGNPGGRPSEKEFVGALRLALSEPDETGKRKLRSIADRLVEAAVNGESWAIQQVADRLDGKPAQESTITVDDKRDAPDWTRADLVAFLNDARKSSNGTSPPNGRANGADKLH